MTCNLQISSWIKPFSIRKQKAASIVEPYEDVFDESIEYAYEDDYMFDEITLKDFAEDFMDDYEMAVEHGNFNFIQDSVKPESHAHEKLKAHISEFKGKDVRFNFISGKALNVVIENEHAIVTVAEEFNIVEPNGETTSFNRERSYTIVMAQYGYYLITELSMYD